MCGKVLLGTQPASGAKITVSGYRSHTPCHELELKLISRSNRSNDLTMLETLICFCSHQAFYDLRKDVQRCCAMRVHVALDIAMKRIGFIQTVPDFSD